MSTKTSDDEVLLHSGRKGMKWYQHIFGGRRSSSNTRRSRKHTDMAKKTLFHRKAKRAVDELAREQEYINMYKHRDKMSTKALKAKVARIEAERKFKELVEAPGKARAEAAKKRQQARLQTLGRVASATLDVYSKMPSTFATRKINKNDKKAMEKAIADFKKSQEWAKAFKDVPNTLTKFTQSVNIRGVDIYIPESVQKSEEIKHYGKKGMKWKKRNPRISDAVNNAIEDIMYGVDNRAIQSHIRDSLRDKKTAEQNMADNISKIKSNVRNGKTANKAEQKYLDAYKRSTKDAERASKILEMRRKHAKDMRDLYRKDKKNRG